MPDAAGVKVTDTVHEEFTSSEVPQLLVWLNSLEFTPPNTMLDITSGPVPELLSVTVCAAETVLRGVVAKVNETGLAVAEGTPTPVPVNPTVWVEPAILPALSLMVKVALRAPGAPGVKVTEMLQFAPAATEVQALVAPKSPGLVPLMETPLTVRVAEPLLVTVIICAAPITPTF